MCTLRVSGRPMHHNKTNLVTILITNRLRGNVLHALVISVTPQRQRGNSYPALPSPARGNLAPPARNTHTIGNLGMRAQGNHTRCGNRSWSPRWEMCIQCIQKSAGYTVYLVYLKPTQRLHYPLSHEAQHRRLAELDRAPPLRHGPAHPQTRHSVFIGLPPLHVCTPSCVLHAQLHRSHASLHGSIRTSLSAVR